MKINDFEALWHKKTNDKPVEQAFWNKRAKEFNTHRSAAREKRMDTIIQRLIDLDLLKADHKVIDIGCGTGDLTLKLSSRVEQALGIDFSSEMLRYAKQNAVEQSVSNAQFQTIDWEEITIKESEWYKRFDLACAVMCPAIKNKTALEKMMAVSRRHCLIVTFAERHNRLRDQISSLVDIENLHQKTGLNVYCIFNILWLMGHRPEITYYSSEWTSQYALSEAVELYLGFFALSHELDPKQSESIETFLKKQAVDGIVVENTSAKMAMISWSI